MLEGQVQRPLENWEGQLWMGQRREALLLVLQLRTLRVWQGLGQRGSWEALGERPLVGHEVRCQRMGAGLGVLGLGVLIQTEADKMASELLQRTMGSCNALQRELEQTRFLPYPNEYCPYSERDLDGPFLLCQNEGNG